ncbi:MAG: hypothetical protein LBD36_00310 [Holosporales bacterium]|jgi:hypothetical protein|nr:hypothetical protein [Holosporales bacterium]
MKKIVYKVFLCSASTLFTSNYAMNSFINGVANVVKQVVDPQYGQPNPPQQPCIGQYGQQQVPPQQPCIGQYGQPQVQYPQQFIGQYGQPQVQYPLQFIGQYGQPQVPPQQQFIGQYGQPQVQQQQPCIGQYGQPQVPQQQQFIGQYGQPQVQQQQPFIDQYGQPQVQQQQQQFIGQYGQPQVPQQQQQQFIGQYGQPLMPQQQQFIGQYGQPLMQHPQQSQFPAQRGRPSMKRQCQQAKQSPPGGQYNWPAQQQYLARLGPLPGNQHHPVQQDCTLEDCSLIKFNRIAEGDLISLIEASLYNIENSNNKAQDSNAFVKCFGAALAMVNMDAETKTRLAQWVQWKLEQYDCRNLAELKKTSQICNTSQAQNAKSQLLAKFDISINKIKRSNNPQQTADQECVKIANMFRTLAYCTPQETEDVREKIFNALNDIGINIPPTLHELL